MTFVTQWTKIAVVMGADTDNNCDITITTIVTALGNNNVTLAQTFVWSTGTPDDVTTISWLSTIRDSARSETKFLLLFSLVID